MFVVLRCLNNTTQLTSELLNEIKTDYEFYGITQDPKTKNFMLALYYKCKNCNHVCNAIHFQQNFESWTSGNDDIDRIIQNTQLSAHYNTKKALEWIPYNRFSDINYNEEIGAYIANRIDGHIDKWDYENRNWKRFYKNMLVTLINLDNPKNFTLESINEFKPDHEFYGMTHDPETKNYMMVSNYIYKNCEECNCVCNVIHFQQNFINWTSGSDNIDSFIQNTQLSAHHNVSIALEWIPYDRFENIEYIAKGGFGKVYKANWIDGLIDKWNIENQNWKRRDKNMLVALKSLNHSKNITLEFMNEMICHRKVEFDHRIIKFYGITQDPETENYVMVLEYADDGSLRKYLDKNYNKLNWENKIICLEDIINGLEFIHESNLIHRDLHIGNILKLKSKTAITDMGLCKPTNYNTQKHSTYGVLPYIAPEILLGKNYTKAADIYSFGINMYEVISGLPPFYEISHDENLAIKICLGYRPSFNIKVPQLIVQLIKRCLDADPLNRPSAEEI
ncbi:kinase-like domain-containing protein, partial [Rhizophagus diaphanus]